MSSQGSVKFYSDNGSCVDSTVDTSTGILVSNVCTLNSLGGASIEVVQYPDCPIGKTAQLGLYESSDCSTGAIWSVASSTTDQCVLLYSHASGRPESFLFVCVDVDSSGSAVSTTPSSYASIISTLSALSTPSSTASSLSTASLSSSSSTTATTTSTRSSSSSSSPTQPTTPFLSASATTTTSTSSTPSPSSNSGPSPGSQPNVIITAIVIPSVICGVTLLAMFIFWMWKPREFKALLRKCCCRGSRLQDSITSNGSSGSSGSSGNGYRLPALRR